LHPGITLVRNIGFDELSSNTNSGTELLESKELSNNVPVNKIEFEESVTAREAYKTLFLDTRGSSRVKLFLYKNYSSSILIRLFFRYFIKINKLF
jgi:hypothetical protein